MRLIRQTAGRIALFLAACLLAAGASPAAAAEPAATPQRPSLSFNAFTVADGIFEVESGALVTDTGGSLPLFGKYGLTDRFELEVGFDPIRMAETDEGVESSLGDITLGLRASDGHGHMPSVAGVVWMKLPTADEETGSGEPDFGGIGILSIPLGDLSLDANLWWSAMGRDGDSFLGQVQGTFALSVPLAGRWSAYGEVALQSTAREGSGGFFDAGASYAATPRAVLDAAAGFGWSDGYPDWIVTVGWTLLARTPRTGSAL